jgi:hypothetical protein
VLATDPKIVRDIVGGALVLLFYGSLFARTLRQNRGNKVIEFGAMTIMLFLAMAFTSRFLPFWAFGLLLALVFLLCIITLFFLVKRGWDGAHRHKSAEQKKA